MNSRCIYLYYRVRSSVLIPFFFFRSSLRLVSSLWYAGGPEVDVMRSMYLMPCASVSVKRDLVWVYQYNTLRLTTGMLTYVLSLRSLKFLPGLDS